MTLEKRYTLKALKNWFQAYRKHWWDSFSKEDTKLGIHLLDNIIKTIEIQPSYILICGKKDGITHFATIDLHPDGSLSWKISSQQETLYRGLLTAGLVVLERLFENHIDELSIDNTEQIFESQKEILSPSTSFQQTQTIKLIFSKLNQAVFLEIYFKRQTSWEKLNSLEKEVKTQERGYLMSIMLQIQKYGFQWKKDHFESDLLDLMPDFIRMVVPKLSKKYFVECKESVQKLGKGYQDITVNLLEKEGHLIQKFSVESGEIDSNTIKYSLKLKKPVYWSEKHGLLRWSNQTFSWAQHLDLWKHRLPNGQLPRYLNLSIFNPSLQTFSKVDIPTLQQKEIDPFLPSDIHLRSYQMQGILWLLQMLEASYHPLLADEMGLGKTRQLLGALSVLLKKENKPALIVCPTSVLGAWQNEIGSCFPHLSLTLLLQDNVREISSSSASLYLISYAQLRILSDQLKQQEFSCVILDEAQTIKNQKSKSAYACFRLKAKYRIASTGTPLENNLQDIWTIFHFLMPGLLGNHKEFHKFILKDDQQKQLKAQIAPFILRRTRDMVLQELPEKEEIVVFCPMTVEQQKQYFQMLRRRTEIKTGQWMQLLTLILRLRQLCCDPWLISHSNESTIQKSGKLIWLLEKLKEISQEKSSKIIIFSQFTSLLERLQAIVNTLYPKTYLLTGKTLSLQRRQLIKSFQEQQQAAFLISLKAGGTGITLNTADTIFILDPWWNPAVEQQAIARAHRLGQAHSLVVYRLLIEDSIESNIQQMQATKTQLFSRLFDGKSTNNTQNYWDQLYKLLETKENSLRNPNRITHT